MTDQEDLFIPDAVVLEIVQDLWSGYGQIERLQLKRHPQNTLIRKVVRPPVSKTTHPRGWNSAFADQRKRRSYEVELVFYRRYARHCTPHCRVPAFYDKWSSATWTESLDPSGRPALKTLTLTLEDLNAQGFAPVSAPNRAQQSASLRWLAHFHSTFLYMPPKGLWQRGGYWHLDTRPEEYAQMEPGLLKTKARIIEDRLHHGPQTLIHGDAKVANFCFRPGRIDNTESFDAAAVDFQYVGGGCGIKDVAYFLGSCLPEGSLTDQDNWARQHLNDYLRTLGTALHSRFSTAEVSAVLNEWEACFELAWADFQRFLLGWAPAHPKNSRLANDYTERVLTNL